MSVPFPKSKEILFHAHKSCLAVYNVRYPLPLLHLHLHLPLTQPRKLAYAMKSTRFSSVDFRARSTVPIGTSTTLTVTPHSPPNPVKFKDPFSGLDCDLNVNERLGIVNSDMIKEFCDNSTVLRPLLFSIKEWAKPRGLNSPSVDRESPSFSSYAFALMTITFLQVFFVSSLWSPKSDSWIPQERRPATEFTRGSTNSLTRRIEEDRNVVAKTTSRVGCAVQKARELHSASRA